jgi:glycosyltransferase involved in cell wall biosynthesis
MPLRILYVLKRFPRLSETFVLNEILELERRGADIRVCSLLRMAPGLVHPGLARLRAPVAYPPPTVRGSVDTARGLQQRAQWIADEVAAHGVPHLHAHFATSAAEVAYLTSRLTGVPFSLTAHAKDIYHDSVDFDRLRRLIAAARFVVTVSDFNVRHLLERCGADLREKIVRLYNGIDIAEFGFAGAGDRLPDAVLAVGRLIEKKGFADLIDAIATLRDRGRHVRLTIVGEGPLEADLCDRVRSRQLGGQVSLLGARPQDRVVELMHRHTIMALPCVVGTDGNRDGLPTVLLEAMAAGLPVVSTSVTGIPEIVENGRSGLIVEPHRPDGLAAAIATLLDDPGLRARIARAARRRVCERFDLSRNVGRLARLMAEHQTAAPALPSGPLVARPTAGAPAPGRIAALGARA